MCHSYKKKNLHYPDFTTQFRLQLIILREGTGAIFLKDQHLFSRKENSQSLLKPFTLYPGRQKLLVAREKEPLVLALQRSRGFRSGFRREKTSGTRVPLFAWTIKIIATFDVAMLCAVGDGR